MRDGTGGCDDKDVPAGRESFEIGVGNWERVDERKFPKGIEPLAARVRQRGMKFGIWFEFERAHRSSDWVRKHPEWYFDIGEEYLHIDMRNADACRAVLELMCRAAETLGAEWIKLDYNIGPIRYWREADPSGRVQIDYMHGLYETLQAFRYKHPGVLLECCASGGRRIDLGMLRQHHTAFLSDHTRFPEICRYMQAGAGYLFPGTVCTGGISLGPDPKYPPVSEYTIASRMLGTVCLFGDIRHLDSAQTRLIAGMVKTYKSYRHLLDEDFFPLLKQPTDDTEWEAVAFVSRDRLASVVFVFSGLENAAQEPNVFARELDPNARYSVRELFSGTELFASIEGRQLMQTPLAPGLAPRSCVAHHIVAC